MPSYGINHESGTLKRVMVHHPGKELELANANPVAHHFDMPVDIKRFISDHQELVDALKDAGVEVLLVRDLIADNKEIIAGFTKELLVGFIPAMFEAGRAVETTF
ncbi:MAG: hypothetical protein ACERKS_09860, partial [Candidatus Bathyarchaeota archaeon]